MLYAKNVLGLVTIFLMIFSCLSYAQLPVTDGLALHLEPSGIVESEVEGVMHVTAWLDSSGNGYDAGPTPDPLELPVKIVDPMTGLDMVHFEDDGLLIPSDSNSLTPKTDGITILVVANTDEATANQYYIQKANTGSTVEGWSVNMVDRGRLGSRICGKGGTDDENRGWLYKYRGTTDRVIVTTIFYYDQGTNIGEVYAAVNGDDTGYLSNIWSELYYGNSNPDADVEIGNLFYGDIAEIIIYDAELSQTELESMYTYLSNKYYIDTPFSTGCEAVWAAGEGEEADVNKDCLINIDDFVEMANNWLLSY
ncbi:MAG: hypothetical protein ACIAQZ_04550 [Sedimentisphaeraceae bacterium JB056]